MKAGNIFFTCPKCGRGRHIDSCLSGLETLCLYCFEKVTVPGSFTAAFYNTMQQVLHSKEGQLTDTNHHSRTNNSTNNRANSKSSNAESRAREQQRREQSAKTENERLEREHSAARAREEEIRKRAEKQRADEEARRIRDEEIKRAKEADERTRREAEARDQQNKKRAEETRRAEEEARKRSEQRPRDNLNKTSDDIRYGSILGLKGQVSMSDVKRIYKELAMQYHPDKVSHLGPKLRHLAENEMKQINEAYNYFRNKYG